MTEGTESLRKTYTCLRCGKQWNSHMDTPRRCPACSSYFWNEPPRDFVCLKCGHSWKARVLEVPNICPKCKSTGWNDARSEMSSGNPDQETVERVSKLYKDGAGVVSITMELKISMSSVIRIIRSNTDNVVGLRM